MDKDMEQMIAASFAEELLARFDVREHEFQRVMAEALSKKNVKEEVKRYFEAYSKSDNIVVKTAIGKKLTDTYNYDYDASLFANMIYRMTMVLYGDVSPYKGDIYKITRNRIDYRGDTMNSWQTTVNEYFGLAGHDPANYEDKDIPPYMTRFMQVVYTIGNFIPVPLLPVPYSFNCQRYTLVKDYWDLTLLAIYRHYMDRDKTNDTGWKALFQHHTNKRWLSSYGSGQDGWDGFVDKNFMQPFLQNSEPVNGHYGPPAELWDGHFNGNILPQKDDLKNEFEQFFTNATERILARGRRIAQEVLKQNQSAFRLDWSTDPITEQ